MKNKYDSHKNSIWNSKGSLIYQLKGNASWARLSVGSFQFFKNANKLSDCICEKRRKKPFLTLYKIKVNNLSSPFSKDVMSSDTVKHWIKQITKKTGEIIFYKGWGEGRVKWPYDLYVINRLSNNRTQCRETNLFLSHLKLPTRWYQTTTSTYSKPQSALSLYSRLFRKTASFRALGNKR